MKSRTRLMNSSSNLVVMMVVVMVMVEVAQSETNLSAHRDHRDLCVSNRDAHCTHSAVQAKC